MKMADKKRSKYRVGQVVRRTVAPYVGDLAEIVGRPDANGLWRVKHQMVAWDEEFFRPLTAREKGKD